jgi:hypothetical protein
MRIRRVGVAALTSALVLGGLVATSVGVASAKKIVVQGTLSCTTAGTTTITPGLVLQKTNLTPPKYKDKKPKFVTAGSGSACTGTTTSGLQPTSYTLTSKAKGLSRLIVNPDADCNAPGRLAKTKITFNTGDKLKADMVSEVGNYAYNTATGVSTPFPACGSGSDVAIAFAVAHANDRIETRSTGTSTGKAYAGKVIHTKSVTVQTLSQELAASNTATGVTSLSAESAFSTLTIG